MSSAATTVEEKLALLTPDEASVPVWKHFFELTMLPRPSKQEDRVIEFLEHFARSRDLAFQRDTVGNVLIKRQGSGGGEGAPPVLIQNHIDMVTEKVRRNRNESLAILSTFPRRPLQRTWPILSSRAEQRGGTRLFLRRDPLHA